MMKKLWLIFAGSVCSFFGGGCMTPSTEGIPAVLCFDAGKYCGVWYEIERLPNWFEKGMTNVKAHYSLAPDGTLKVVNSGLRRGKSKNITGRAWFTTRPEVGCLKVQFFFPFSGLYKIICLDKEYSVAVVTGGDYSQLWILARKPQISQELLIKLVQYVTALGYESDKLIFTEQKWQKSVQ